MRRAYGRAPQWSDDETVMARVVSTEVHIYGADLAAGVQTRIKQTSVHSCAIAPGSAPHRIAVAVNSVKVCGRDVS